MSEKDLNNITHRLIVVAFWFLAVTAAFLAMDHQAHAATKASLTLTVPDSDQVISIGDEQATSWRTPVRMTTTPALHAHASEPQTLTSYTYDPAAIYQWLKETTKHMNQTVQEPTMTVEHATVSQFTPPINGTKIDVRATTFAIVDALEHSLDTIPLILYTTTPNTSLGQLNTLGISERIGHGVSKFNGSPKNRRHNIDVGYNKLKGVLIAPGQEFSFDEHICPVDKQTGYLPELVIKREGTIPEYGGGLCQVSSTLFRSVMDAGLQITQRKNHSYAVQYYAPQGTDATTYCGGVDFKFRNDTANTVMIWPYLEDKDTLVFDLYGTKDNRIIQVDKPIQYDRKSDGSMKATWTRTVTKDGVAVKDTFNSTYLPPALFHKEEKLDSPGQGTVPTTNTVPPSEPTTPPQTPPASTAL